MWRRFGNVGNVGSAIANTESAIANTENDIANIDRDIANNTRAIANTENDIANIAAAFHARPAKIGTVANAGLRIEIHKRTLKDGSTSLHGIFRKRGKDRTYVDYISTQEIQTYPQRLANYRPRPCASAPPGHAQPPGRSARHPA